MVVSAAHNPVHSRPYYIIVHGTIFLAETAVMGLMSWIMSAPTQGQLTGGEDATGNMPGYVFLMAFFSWIHSLATIGLWLVGEYYPPLTRALIQTFILLPLNGAVGFLLGWQNNWTVFLGSCQLGSILCKSVWKTLVRIEGVSTFLIGVVCLFTLIDIIAAFRLHRLQRTALRRLVRMTTVKAAATKKGAYYDHHPNQYQKVAHDDQHQIQYPKGAYNNQYQNQY